jgi:hypothetical protein
MARISYVEKEQAPKELQLLYEQMEKRIGFMPNALKGFAHTPELVTAFYPFMMKILGPGRVDSLLKEIAFLRTSVINECSY